MEKEEKKTNYTVLRVAVIAVVLVLLVFVSIGIVKFVPKALNSLANASLSIGSLFTSGTSTDATIDTGTTPVNTSITTSTGGFSIRDLTNPNQNNNTISGNTSGIGDSSNAGQNNSNSNTNTSNNVNTNSNTNTAVRPSSNTSRTVGASDISVEILSKGIIDRTTGAFIPSNSFTASDAVVVKFKIENRGPYATGPWSARGC